MRILLNNLPGDLFLRAHRINGHNAALFAQDTKPLRNYRIGRMSLSLVNKCQPVKPVLVTGIEKATSHYCLEGGNASIEMFYTIEI